MDLTTAQHQILKLFDCKNISKDTFIIKLISILEKNQIKEVTNFLSNQSEKKFY